MQRRIFLIGFMGSGKTTLGSKLARELGYVFVDMDALIEETSGMTIPDIFSQLGEEVFRKWERDILLELCGREKVVIATGGGAPCHGTMMETMNEKGTTVYIRLDPGVLTDRLIRSPTDRPLIRGKNKEELRSFIEAKLAEREKHYLKASLVIDGVGLQAQTLVEALRKSEGENDGPVDSEQSR